MPAVWTISADVCSSDPSCVSVSSVRTDGIDV